MKKTTGSRRTTILAFTALLACSSALAAEPQSLTLKDWTGRGFPPDLVNYTINAPKDGGNSMRVLDAAGKPLAVQVTPGEGGKATLSFVAEIAPGGTSAYTVRQDGPAAPAAVSTMQEANAQVLANRQLAVRVPLPQDQTFEQPVAADTLPAPILAFRGQDGAWRGAGALLHKRPVKKFTVTQTANGPVFTEIRYRLDYAGGGWYEAAVRVTERAPFVQIREEYDLGIHAATDFWQLDLSAGWQPDAAEHMSVAGQGAGKVQHPSLAQEEKANPGSIDPSLNTTANGDAPVRLIHHDSCWGGKFVSYYGVHNAERRASAPDNYPLAIVAPLHKGDWRRANSMPVHIKGNQVHVRFPMSVTPTSWLNEPRSDTSPFSCHEHDPALPSTYGRRVWGLVLAKPALFVTAYGDATTATSIGYAVRALYGIVGLDRYKDFILDWPDTGTENPRVFITPEGVEEYRQAVKADPNFALGRMLGDYYWFTGDPATAQKELPAVHRDLQQNVNYITTSLSIHHHHTLAAYGGPIGHTESVLSWPGLPAADREAIRARLALLSYLLVEPDVTSAGNGSHHGNPNMGVSRLMDRSNVAALIPDHPRHRTWADYMGMFMAYKSGSFMAPEGAWFEYGASYHMHGYGKILRGLMGVLSSAPPAADQVWAYNRADLDYFLNLLSPVDSRYGSRTIPGAANSPVGQSPHYLQSMGTVAGRDPEFAANLRWGWDQNGRMIGTGADSVTIPAMVRPEIPAVEPVLGSRVYPGFGVIFRAHQGLDETALFLRSGYHWSHWGQDQGNLMLYARGAVLLPPQPYQYGGPRDKGFPDRNFMRFGAPTNDLPHAWPDSNIIDSYFAPSVDYAWSSTGYPDWYITPGAKPEWVSGDRKRELASGINQNEGAFTWDRQIAFLKGKSGGSPNYFVIRDDVNGEGRLASWFFLNLLGRKDDLTVDGARITLDSEWSTDLDVYVVNREKPAFEMAEDDLTLAVGAYSKPTGSSPNWIDGNTKERHVLLRLQNAPGQEVAWVLYPRAEGEAAPTVAQLAPGVVKVVTPESTDYVFLSTKPFEYTGEGVTFSGLAGAVRIAEDGKATLVLSAGPGTVGYKDAMIESAVPFQKTLAANQRVVEEIPAPSWKIGSDLPPVSVQGNAVRFVEPQHKYVELVHGNVGIRGMGPFDLTFTADDISGVVDGGVRTLVATWPENITRPGYFMDDSRWYAGFADEHSIVKGTERPQFGIAFGVSAGPHTVRIAEWEWAPMPEAPPRAEVVE